MSLWTYILQSATTGRLYCGSTDDCARRLLEHNDPDYHGSKTTKRFEGPWELIWCENHLTRGHAMQREKQIKKRGIGRFLAEARSVESRAPRD
ncbi:MAG: GIY-YIG nuclease family protein [Candidatus Hydrogenedentes bacterium]|nr:GIY-YIG nuclease family protein [Candidatus Hydrogenedentota bacterium]